MTSVFLRASTELARNDVDDEDVGIEGVYEISLDDKTPKEAFANASLDGFHSHVSVSTLDDFVFSVRESADPASAEIQSSDNFEDYTLDKHVASIDKIAEPFVVLAHFQPQAWINDYAVDIDGAQNVDVTHDVLKLAKSDLSALHAVKDYRDSSDYLVEGHSAQKDHSGPFTVRVESAITQSFRVSELSEITEAMVAEAETRAAPEAKKAPRPG